LVGGDGVIKGSREAVLGRKAVVQREHRRIAVLGHIERQLTVGLRRAEEIAATVEIEYDEIVAQRRPIRAFVGSRMSGLRPRVGPTFHPGQIFSTSGRGAPKDARVLSTSIPFRPARFIVKRRMVRMAKACQLAIFRLPLAAGPHRAPFYAASRFDIDSVASILA